MGVGSGVVAGVTDVVGGFGEGGGFAFAFSFHLLITGGVSSSSSS